MRSAWLWVSRLELLVLPKEELEVAEALFRFLVGLRELLTFDLTEQLRGLALRLFVGCVAFTGLYSIVIY